MSAVRVVKKMCSPSRCVFAFMTLHFALYSSLNMLHMLHQLHHLQAWLGVQEPSTCHYVLTVAVPGLCQLPIFRAQPEPITQIVCRPVAAAAAEGSTADHKSQQQQRANFEDGNLVQDDSGHESTANSTDLHHHDS